VPPLRQRGVEQSAQWSGDNRVLRLRRPASPQQSSRAQVGSKVGMTVEQRWLQPDSNDPDLDEELRQLYLSEDIDGTSRTDWQNDRLEEH
jgi:hypothetical protein